MKQRITIWLLILLATDACVEPYSAPVIEVMPRIVVDALLTDLPGPQQVRLFYSSALDAEIDEPQPITDATLSITDEVNQVEHLAEVSDGTYQTRSDFAGIVGKAYKLSIQLETGEKLESDFIEMEPAGYIRQLYYEYEPNAINMDDPKLPQDVVKIFLDGEGSGNDLTLLRWRWRGTYQVQTRPELKTKRNDEGAIVPDPIPCSGYVVNNVGILSRVSPCECCDCWPTEFNSNANASNNQTVNNTFNRIYLGQIPIDQWRFLFKYHVEVEQLSVTPDVHRFWKLVQAQQQGGSNIFQPNVVKVKGNIRALAGDSEVFGVFSVSAVTSGSIDIHRADLPIPRYTPEVVVQDCRTYRENSSNVKPLFW